MFEIGIFCVILFAVVYWAILFIMGRHDDVLHGEFVEAEPELVATGVAMPFPAPMAPPVPMVVAKEQAAPPPLAVAKQQLVPPPTPIAASVTPRPLVNLPPANPEALQSLLISLKQELKNAAKI